MGKGVPPPFGTEEEPEAEQQEQPAAGDKNPLPRRGSGRGDQCEDDESAGENGQKYDEGLDEKQQRVANQQLPERRRRVTVLLDDADAQQRVTGGPPACQARDQDEVGEIDQHALWAGFMSAGSAALPAVSVVTRRMSITAAMARRISVILLPLS